MTYNTSIRHLLFSSFYLNNTYVDMTIRVTKKVFGEELRLHKEGTQPEGIEENIARIYKGQSKPLTNHGYRIYFTLKTKKLTRWSEQTRDFQNRGELFCTEFEKAFSWRLLSERLEAAFKDQLL